jgi:hypothetical protein
MSWNANHNQILNIVELVFTSLTTAQDLKEATSKCIALGKENETNRFLVNAEELELLAPLVDIYDLPDKQYIAEQADRFSRIAVVLPRSSQAKEAVQFYETVCMNRGWAAKIVSTRQDAVDWLVGGNT